MVGAAEIGRIEDRISEVCRAFSGFGIEHIEPRTDFPGLERREQCGLVHDFTAGRVDQDGIGLHQGQARGIEGFRRDLFAVDDEHFVPGDQLMEILGRDRWVVGYEAPELLEVLEMSLRIFISDRHVHVLPGNCFLVWPLNELLAVRTKNSQSHGNRKQGSLVFDLQALRALQGQAFFDVAEIEAVEHIGAAADHAGFGRGGGKTRELGVIGIIA